MNPDALKSYQEKRNFAVTSEPNLPKIADKRANSKKLIFVVQEHHSRQLHYDFRLEVDGALFPRASTVQEQWPSGIGAYTRTFQIRMARKSPSPRP